MSLKRFTNLSGKIKSLLILTSERARKETLRAVRGLCTLAYKPGKKQSRRKTLSTLQVTETLSHLNGFDQKNTYKKEKSQSSYQMVQLQMMLCKVLSLAIAGS